MTEFYVGQKVVCVDAKTLPPFSENVWNLKEGAIYIVRWHGIDEFYRLPCILVDGALNKTAGEKDYPFAARRFRPLEEKPDRIAIFRQIALDVTEGHKVRIES